MEENDFNSYLDIQSGFSPDDMKIIFMILGIIAVVVITLVIVMVVQLIFTAKSQRIQREHFNATLDLIKDIQLANSNARINAAHDIPQLPGKETIDFNELQELAAKCEEVGSKIDGHTNRPNNSKAVSELVFKVSTALGLEKNLSTLYFCAAMVYDAGFLDLPADLFHAEILTVAERKLMRTHVMRSASYLDFIPHKYYPIFTEAAMLHHENTNGTGYPEGLKGTEIPQLARIIHAVESYVSLVNRRSYHKMLSKDDAIAELRRQPGIFVLDVIDTLETLV